MALTANVVLEHVVRSWVGEDVPGEPVIAEQAVAVARAACDSGGSIEAAHRQVSEFLNYRRAHPTNQSPDSHMLAVPATRGVVV